ncbi:MAG: ABC transporter ATP-binding protein [Pseudomonadota bacterium]
MVEQHPSPAIAIESLHFSWPGGASAFAFTIVQFALSRGESVVLVGPSGGGKSTLLGLVTGVLKPLSGALQVLDADLASLASTRRDAFRAQHMGIIFQQFNLLPYLSVVDNVLLPLRFSKDRARKAGKDAQAQRATALQLLADLGLDTADVLERRAANMSVGQQQRIAAARAFLGEPELIIADEPTSALDEGHQQAFLDQLFEQQKRTGAALLMVSHDSRVAARFDRVVALEDLLTANTKEGYAA